MKERKERDKSWETLDWETTNGGLQKGRWVGGWGNVVMVNKEGM